MANTVIQIKYSTVTAAPTSLANGELAYSYVGGGNLFIGNANSTGVITLPVGNTGVIAGSYGGSANIPTFTVDTKGRLSFAGNVAISSGSVSAAGNTGSGTYSGSMNVKGGGSGGITTNFNDTDDTFYVSVDSTVIRTTGTQTIGGDLTVSGNFTVTGTQTIVNSTTVSANDSLIKLANNNITGDTLDIGFYGVANTGTAPTYHGLVRRAAGNFFLFKNLPNDPTGNVLQAADVTAGNTATLRANLTGGTVSSLAAAIGIADGGTNQTSFTSGQYIIFDGTRLTSIANSGVTAGTYGNTSFHPVITVDAYGRITSATNTAIAIDTSAITSGTLGVARGGTGLNTYTTGDLLYASGTTTLANLADVATGNTLISGGIGAAPSWGKVGLTTHVSGTLGVGNGGTGATSFSANGVIYGGLTSTSPLLSVASATEGHILQINTSGIPTFGYLQGGTF